MHAGGRPGRGARREQALHVFIDAYLFGLNDDELCAVHGWADRRTARAWVKMGAEIAAQIISDEKRNEIYGETRVKVWRAYLSRLRDGQRAFTPEILEAWGWVNLLQAYASYLTNGEAFRRGKADPGRLVRLGELAEELRAISRQVQPDGRKRR